MNTNDIKHLAQLSRLHLKEEEVVEYTKQFDEIVGYVDKIKEFANEASEESQDTTQVRDENIPANILREDIAATYQDPQKIINEAPSHQDNFVKVKKILNQ